MYARIARPSISQRRDEAASDAEIMPDHTEPASGPSSPIAAGVPLECADEIVVDSQRWGEARPRAARRAGPGAEGRRAAGPGARGVPQPGRVHRLAGAARGGRPGETRRCGVVR